FRTCLGMPTTSGMAMICKRADSTWMCLPGKPLSIHSSRTTSPQTDSEGSGASGQETTMGFYSQVIVPILCDVGLDRPFVARHRRELLAHARGNILEIGFGTGLNLPCYPHHVRKVTTVDPNVGMYRRARKRIKQAGIEVDQQVLGGERLPFED